MKETTFEEKSGLRLFSLGIVIVGADPKRPPDEIIVSPIESMNIQTPGLMVAPKKEMRAGHPDEKGKVTKNKLEVQDYIRAKWISLNGSNRATPPTVYPNETVILYKYSNHDEYYWAPAMHEPHLRRKETASFSFSNMPANNGWGKDGKPIAYDRSTSYWFEVDSFKKLVSLTTPKNDGEKAVYTFSINGATGTVTISDDKGTSITLTTDSGINITTVGSVGINGSKGVNIGGPRVDIGNFVYIGGEMETKQDVIVNGDLYTNTLFCDKLVEDNGPTRNKFRKDPPKKQKLDKNGKQTADDKYTEKGKDPNKPDKVTDWLLEITRPDGFYNADGSVNADVTSAAAAADAAANTANSADPSATNPNGVNALDDKSSTDNLLRYLGIDPSTYVPGTSTPSGTDWRGEPIQTTTL